MRFGALAVPEAYPEENPETKLLVDLIRCVIY